MTEMVFFLEERSAEEMLKGVLPRILPETIVPRFVVFEGKQDLEKRLPIKLKAWRNPHCLFVVMRDQDSGDCVAIKNSLAQKCADAGKPETLVRIACRELESFYLGDWEEPENQLYPKLLTELAEEFRAYAERGGQVFVSSHSPDFLNAVELDEVFWLVKEAGYTQIRRARDDEQIAAFMAEGDQMGYLWKQGFFEGVDPQ